MLNRIIAASAAGLELKTILETACRELAGGIAHDFNNLLTVITGYTEIARDLLPPDDPVRVELDGIKKATKRATMLTWQLLAFSRRQVFKLTDMEKMLRRIIGGALDAGVERVKADPGQIEQVIINLVINARDAMPQGGRITLETANVELDEAYAGEQLAVQPERYVMLTVSDTGVGMNEEVLSNLFEPFFTTKEEGTGLGLVTVYGIVKQGGGVIDIYSESGKGTTFKIYLPRTEEE